MATGPVPDTAETVYISSLALLKMLKHGMHFRQNCAMAAEPTALPNLMSVNACWKFGAGRAGVPLEVMGLMIGDFVDEYTVRVLDVFAMPQHGTGVSVEAVDPIFQQQMLDMLKQTGRYVEQSETCTLGPQRSPLRQPSHGCNHYNPSMLIAPDYDLIYMCSDRKWSSAGIIHIPDSAFGCPAQISEHSRCVTSRIMSLSQ